MSGLIGARHALQMQCFRALGCNCEADQATSEPGHEVDSVGRRHLCRNDKVALVFALFGVHQDEHAALTRIFENLVDGRELLVNVRLIENPQLIHSIKTYWPKSLAT